MALQGKFLVDNEPLAPLTMYGVGTFMAFSGDEIYRNRGGCTAVPDKGPIPAGKYWILARPVGGLLSQAEAWAKDTYNGYRGTPTHHSEWFALYRDDGLIDDYTWIKGVKRGNFRLHPAGGHGVSLGCITVASNAEFQTIRRALLHTAKIDAGNSGLKSYGWIEVVTYGSTCP
jgi:hypothetical protein